MYKINHFIFRTINLKAFSKNKSSYSENPVYFIFISSISWYTENSIIVNKAIVVNAIRETEKPTKKERIKIILKR